jgi:hypothetical protein
LPPLDIFAKTNAVASIVLNGATCGAAMSLDADDHGEDDR